MTLITDGYRKLNTQLHADKPGFGAAGDRWADETLALCELHDTLDVLDYGCGKGKLAQALHFDIHGYDPAVSAMSQVPKPADIVMCTDVLEHIEPECLQDVLRDIHRVTKKVAFLNISTRRANKSLRDGRNAHLIVNNSNWWDATLAPLFEIDVVSVTATEYNILVTPKKLEKA